MRWNKYVRLTALAAMCAAGQAASLTAQVARGVVRDSASRLPIPGAVVIMVDAAGRLGLRTLTNQRGTFAIPVPPPTDRLRIVRLGFRPVEVKIPRGQDDISLDVVMPTIPYGLQPVRVTGGQKCPRRSDRARALALLEQARDGLLATVVARSSTPASMKRLIFDRRHDGTADRLARHRVQVDTVARTVAAFVAAHSAVDFVADGFTTDSAEEATFHAPDADVLLDDGFANGYCFHIMEPQRERRNQVGLGFRPADRKRGRIDVDGSLWIDTVARALVDIEFKYVGLPVEAERLDPGGRVDFREMPNGVVLIDRWMLRLIGSEPDSSALARTESTASPRGRLGMQLTRLVLAESGGELARVSWADGAAWRGDLGKLSLTLTNLDREPMRHTRVRLDDTNYEATTDSAGRLEIEDLAPGPYSGEILDPRLEPINLTLPMPLKFAATRGSTNTQQVRAGTLEDYVGDLCRQDKNADVGRKPLPSASWVIGRITDPSGESVSGVIATVHYAHRNGAQQPSLKSSPYKIGSDGVFAFCGLKRNDTVAIRFGRGSQVLGNISHDTTDPLSVVAVRLEPPRK